MDVREKLFALFQDCNNPSWKWFPNNAEMLKLIDYLIAHGVTVQEWISIKDRLPEKQGFYRVYHKNSKAICDRFYYKDCPDLFVNVKDDPIIHWKPMEQPPKGE